VILLVLNYAKKDPLFWFSNFNITDLGGLVFGAKTAAGKDYIRCIVQYTVRQRIGFGLARSL